MKYEIKEVRATKKKVEIEVSAEDFNNYYSQTLKKISADAEIPGFRKGKAPEDMVESRVTKEGVLSEAAEIAIRESWAKFLAESKEEAISQPQVEVIKIAKDNPLIFTAEFEILPEIKLPKLDSAKVEKSSVEVTDQEVEDAIKWIQQSRAKYSEKISGAEDGDLVEFTFSCLDIENDPEKKDRIVLGKGHYIEGLEDTLRGMKREEVREFETRYPQENKDKKIKISVKVDSVKKVEIPEVNDEWVKGLGAFNTVEELKKDIKEGIKKDKEVAEIQRVREESIKKLIEKTEIEVPKTLIKREQDFMLDNIKERCLSELKISFEEYLKQVKKTEEEITKELEKIAKEKVKGFLVLHQIVKDEKIEVTEEEISQKIEEMLNQYPNKEEIKKTMDEAQVRLYIEDELKREKAFNLLGC
ncbi:MAG TPA: trigger factor [Candidatus Pacearchaeota archaeon]|nr:trigger factor [Candidatus Pacearchaeota archaeon]